MIFLAFAHAVRRKPPVPTSSAEVLPGSSAGGGLRRDPGVGRGATCGALRSAQRRCVHFPAACVGSRSAHRAQYVGRLGTPTGVIWTSQPLTL